jgi:hypothetical protein
VTFVPPFEGSDDDMKPLSRSARVRTNGRPHSHNELVAAHERALKRFKLMTARERFQSLVKAGIYTSDGKLTPRYGG